MDAHQVFEILVREHADMLWAWLRAGVRDSAAVDDLFQETLLTAWRRLDDFDRTRPFGPWLRGIAARLLMAHYRERAKSAETLSPAAIDWLESRFEQLQRLEGDSFAEKLAALRACVEALPADYQAPVQLRYFEALGLEETGRRLGLAMEAVKKRLFRARARLAECLERKLLAARSPA